MRWDLVFVDVGEGDEVVEGMVVDNDVVSSRFAGEEGIRTVIVMVPQTVLSRYIVSRGNVVVAVLL